MVVQVTRVTGRGTVPPSPFSPGTEDTPEGLQLPWTEASVGRVFCAESLRVAEAEIEGKLVFFRVQAGTWTRQLHFEETAERLCE